MSRILIGYLDPGTGSVILQAILGGVAGAGGDGEAVVAAGHLDLPPRLPQRRARGRGARARGPPRARQRSGRGDSAHRVSDRYEHRGKLGQRLVSRLRQPRLLRPPARSSAASAPRRSPTTRPSPLRASSPPPRNQGARGANRAPRPASSHPPHCKPPAGLRRRPSPRANPLPVLAVRVAVLDAQGRRAADPRADGERPRRGADPQGRHPVQRPVARCRPGLHRRRLVRAPARGRAVVRLPPVLHAVPLSADAAELSRGPVPAAASRTSSRGSRPSRCATCSRCATDFAAACSPTSSCTPGSSAAIRSAARARPAEELKRAGFKPELIKANVGRLARLVRRLDWKPGRSEWSEYRETSAYDEEELARQGGVRRVRDRDGRAEARLGPRLQRRALQPDRRRRGRLRRRGRRRRARGRPPLPRASR